VYKTWGGVGASQNQEHPSTTNKHQGLRGPTWVQQRGFAKGKEKPKYHGNG